MNEKSAEANVPFQPLVESLTRANRFLLSRMEKGIALSRDTMTAYVDLGLAQIKVAAKVSDPHSLHAFADSQLAVLSFVGHRLFDDSRVLNEWSVETCHQARYLARENLLRWYLK